MQEPAETVFELSEKCHHNITDKAITVIIVVKTELNVLEESIQVKGETNYMV